MFLIEYILAGFIDSLESEGSSEAANSPVSTKTKTNCCFLSSSFKETVKMRFNSSPINNREVVFFE